MLAQQRINQEIVLNLRGGAYTEEEAHMDQEWQTPASFSVASPTTYDSLRR
jgi:hypothetical protein